MKLQCNKTVMWSIDTRGSDLGVNTVHSSHLGSISCSVVLALSHSSEGWLHLWLESEDRIISCLCSPSSFPSLASLSQAVGKFLLPTSAHSAAANQTRMLHCVLCAGRGKPLSIQEAGPSSKDWLPESKPESATSSLLFWTSVSLVGRWGSLNLKSTVLCWRQR